VSPSQREDPRPNVRCAFCDTPLRTHGAPVALGVGLWPVTSAVFCVPCAQRIGAVANDIAAGLARAPQPACVEAEAPPSRG